MKYFIFICGLMLGGCIGCTSNYYPGKSVLRDGDFAFFSSPTDDLIICRKAIRSFCGVSVSDCSNGLRYECVKNLGIANLDKVYEEAK